MTAILFMKADVSGYRRASGVYVRAYVRREPILSWAAKILAFLHAATREADFKGECEFDIATEAESKLVEAQGCPPIAGLPHMMMADSVRHAFNNHGNEKIEAGFGQRAITMHDVYTLPLAVGAPDRVTAQKRGDRQGEYWSIKYEKNTADGRLVYVCRFFPTSKRRQPRLVMTTAWVKLNNKGAPTGVESSPSPVSTPERSANVTPQDAPDKLLKASAAQLRAGNYPKEHRRWQGLDISIENPAGSVRSGVGAKGPWSVTMQHAYGYIRRTEGADGDHVDCFLGPDPSAKYVYVVHQRKVGHFLEFDEDKCMLDFPSKQAALEAFYTNYSDPRFMGEVSVLPVADFVAKVKATWDRRPRDGKVSA